jgi:hypothetical protein
MGLVLAFWVQCVVAHHVYCAAGESNGSLCRCNIPFARMHIKSRTTASQAVRLVLGLSHKRVHCVHVCAWCF